MSTVRFDQLSTADLILDAEYQGGSLGTVADDPLAVLLPVGNQGGFRYAGSPAAGTIRFVVLYTSGVDPDWPDALDVLTGAFTYYGDNKTPGSDLHETTRRGNRILRTAFAGAQGGRAGRASVPPFFLFEKTGVGRGVRFRGLLAPGNPSVPVEEQLVAIWRSRQGQRFQNYRSIFTVLDVPAVPRLWIQSLLGQPGIAAGAPAAWTAWVQSGSYTPLAAPPTTIHRSRAEQQPKTDEDRVLVETLRLYFSDHPVAFERCAAELADDGAGR